MTDLEMIVMCAQHMGYEIRTSRPDGVWTHQTGYYCPLSNDDQAFQLITRCGLNIRFVSPALPGRLWEASFCDDDLRTIYAHSNHLNRAIVECCANIEAENKRRLAPK